jgi:hypothetical protein
MFMSNYVQHYYQPNRPKDGLAKVFSLKTRPLDRPHLLSVVNQGGKIKIHAVVDETKAMVKTQFLVVGTGNSIPEDLIDRITKIGQVILDDGQFGYHFYLITPADHEMADTDCSNPIHIIAEWIHGRKVDAPEVEAMIKAMRVNQDVSSVDIWYRADDCVVVNLPKGKVRDTQAFKDLMAFFYDHADVDSVGINKGLGF